MFGNVGLPEVLIILVIILLLFGARRIPEIAGSFGKGIREFKKSMTDVERAISEPDPPAAGSHRLHEPLPADRTAAAKTEDPPEPKRLLS